MARRKKPVGTIGVQEYVHPSGAFRRDYTLPADGTIVPRGWTATMTIVGVPAEVAESERGELLATLREALDSWGLSGRGGPLCEWEDVVGPRRRGALLRVVASSEDGFSADMGYRGGRVVIYGISLPSEGMTADRLDRHIRSAVNVAKLVRRHRPRGTGAFADREELLRTLREVVQRLQAEGKRPTEERVAQALSERGLTIATDARDTLRSWMRRYEVSWERDVLGSID